MRRYLLDSTPLAGYLSGRSTLSSGSRTFPTPSRMPFSPMALRCESNEPNLKLPNPSLDRIGDWCYSVSAYEHLYSYPHSH